MPARRQRPRLGLAVADHAADEQIGIVEGGAVGVCDRVAELAALVDRAGHLGRDMARYATREGELAKERGHAFLVLADVWVKAGVGAFEVGVGDQPRAAVTGARHVDRVQVALADGAVHVHVDEVEARRGAEVAEQPRLDVLRQERLLEQRICQQIDLPDREVVGRAPVSVDQPQLLGRERTLGGNSALLGHFVPPASFRLRQDGAYPVATD